jgi:hypothetical protein
MNDDNGDRDGRSAGELAAALLGHLRLDGGGALLGCGAAERARLGARFHDLAVERLAARGVAREEIGRAERYVVLLVERAFEEVGELPESAAFYALAHDERLARADARADYERAALRFKLGHTLFLLGQHEAANLERCAAFGRETAAAVERLKGSTELPADSVRLLAMELQGWLGGRYEALGETAAAAAAFLEAVDAAGSADDRVAFAARAASALAAAGRVAEAERVLAAVRCDLPELRSDLSRRLWDAGWAALGAARPADA